MKLVFIGKDKTALSKKKLLTKNPKNIETQTESADVRPRGIKDV